MANSSSSMDVTTQFIAPNPTKIAMYNAQRQLPQPPRSSLAASCRASLDNPELRANNYQDNTKSVTFEEGKTKRRYEEAFSEGETDGESENELVPIILLCGDILAEVRALKRLLTEEVKPAVWKDLTE